MNRDRAIGILIGLHDGNDSSYEAIRMAIEALQAEPCEDVIARQEAVEVEERPKGEWIVTMRGYGECSECGFIVGNRFASNFCPNCGSDNRERGEDE